jgi:hypothetical protein
MNVGEFKSFITIEKGRYESFEVVFENAALQQYGVSDASSKTVVTSTWCGQSTTGEKFVFLGTASSAGSLSADTLADILADTPDDYEIEFLNTAPGIPAISDAIPVENAKLEDTTTSSVGSGSSVSGVLTLYETPPVLPCSSSSSSSSS